MIVLSIMKFIGLLLVVVCKCLSIAAEDDIL